MKYIIHSILLLFLSVSSTYSSINIKVLLSSEKKATIIPNSKRSDKIYLLRVDKDTFQTKGKLNISHHKHGFKINNKLFKGKQLDIGGINAIMVNKTPYRGSVTIHHKKNGFDIVNNVSLEHYLYSVVPSEIYTTWNTEAVKAQAVAARTYALYESQRRNGYFDVFDDTRSQVYKGMKAENRKTSYAVHATKGQVLTHNGKLIKSYFSSSIGGMSADGKEIGDNKPYLKPVKSYQARQNPNSSWSLKIPLKKIQQQFKTSKIRSIDISHSSSGRIDSLRIKDSKGKVTKVPGYNFRTKIGANTMKSTRAQGKVSSGYFHIKGSGYGHGVGMGQWEAQELARRGAKYHQILLHFYTDTKLKKLYK